MSIKNRAQLSLTVIALVLAIRLLSSWPAAMAAAEPAKNLLAPTNKVESWRFEQHEGGKGSMKADGEAMALVVTETDGTEWHVQAARPNLELKEGQEYKLTFKAKADAERAIQVNAMIDQDDWHTIGLSESVELTKDWKDCEYTFKAEGVAGMKKNRITFVLGNEKGTVTLKDMVLVEK
jgi:hypothetical protein